MSFALICHSDHQKAKDKKAKNDEHYFYWRLFHFAADVLLNVLDLSSNVRVEQDINDLAKETAEYVLTDCNLEVHLQNGNDTFMNRRLHSKERKVHQSPFIDTMDYCLGRLVRGQCPTFGQL